MGQYLELRMIWNRWRPRLMYLAMSAFVTWHSLALIIAPAPGESDLTQGLHRMLQPYLTFFRLENPWSFFAQIPGSELRYTVEDATGARTEFVPARASWFHPESLWLKDWSYAIVDKPELYADRAGELLCRKHAALHPVSISFVQRESTDYTPDDWYDGKSPLDPEFAREKPLKTVQCPSP